MLATDLIFCRSLVVTDDATNGGRMSAAQIVSGVSGNVWPPVLAAERAVNTVRRRKIFLKINDSANGTAFAPKIFYDGPCAGDDYLKFWAGGQRDTAADITGAERFYTATTLNTGHNAGGQTLLVTLKHASQAAGFQSGDTIRVSSKPTYNGATGTEQYLTISSPPAVNGLDLTITTLEMLSDGYAAGAKLSSVYEPTDILPYLDSASFSGGADVDFASFVLGNIGSTDEDFVATVQPGATSYTVVGDSLGNIGTGTVAADYSPLHPDWSLPRFTIPSSAFDGLTLAAGDTFSFSTHPAAVPVWEEKVNPAGAAVTNSDAVTLVLRVETA